MSNKKTALVIAPGRGTYNKAELGYLGRHHSDKPGFVKTVDDYLSALGKTTITELDTREKYSLKEHTRGDNASPLIYGCAYGDYLSIDRNKFDIAAVTGNSMGWYIALACGGALSEYNAAHLITTMGSLMQDSLIGGQMIYLLVDENWQEIPGRYDYLMGLIADINSRSDCELHVSIMLGGMLVFGGNENALGILQETLEPEGKNFPLRIPNHAAFHTALQRPIAEHAQTLMGADLFSKPSVPLIDGRGQIWSPYSTDTAKLYDYTLGHQVYEYYDFTAAVQVGVKEFAPDCLIVLGPGTTLGGAVAQSLIDINWQGLSSKEDFITRQKSDDPIVLAMGMDEQRAAVIS
jgi:acyl transferase domain-containing protein